MADYLIELDDYNDNWRNNLRKLKGGAKVEDLDTGAGSTEIHYGGRGSGHWKHKGRPGEIGGSAKDDDEGSRMPPLTMESAELSHLDPGTRALVIMDRLVPRIDQEIRPLNEKMQELDDHIKNLQQVAQWAVNECAQKIAAKGLRPFMEDILNDPKVANLNAQLNEAVNQAREYYQNEYLPRVNALINEVHEALYSNSSPKISERFRPDVDPRFTPNAKADMKEALMWMSRTVGVDGDYFAKNAVVITGINSDRSCYGRHADTKQPIIGMGYRPQTQERFKTAVVHEMGHAMDDLSPTISAKCTAYYQKRCDDDPPVYLKDIFNDPAYGTEKTRPDKLPHPYCGKFETEGVAAGKTELLSMGMEMAYNDPVAFYKADQDYFKFVFDCVGKR